MKLSMNIVPSDINEAVAILKALQGFNLPGYQNTAEIQQEADLIKHSMENTKTVEFNTTPAQVESIAEVPANTEATLKFEDLTTEDARDSAGRLWCAEINTSNKGTKADGTFKRAPKLDDEYFNTVIALLDEEAKGDTLAVAPEPQVAPEPVSPPPPAPAPAVEDRKIIGYIHNKSKVQYVPEQLVGWTAEQIAEHCTPVYDEPAPTVEAEDLTVMHSENVNRTIALVSTQGLGPWLKPLVEHFTGGTCNAKMIPVERSREYRAVIEKVEANVSGCKSGAVKWESLI